MGARKWAFALAVFLFVLDIMILPASLPAEPQEDDVLGRIQLFVLIWSLPVFVRVALSIAVAIASLSPWHILVGQQWADGLPCPHIKGGSQWCGLGSFLVLAGWSLRLWSKVSLAALFTYQISLPSALITQGPYAWWVHPGYAGAMAHVMGIVMLLLVALKWRVQVLVVLFGVLCAVISLRIMDEETMLRKEFGAAWDAHVASRWRICPYVW
jgi:protein-S-isoprenylcysteine O-methyltransferase Ste14